jgi:hypothetical protein
VNKVVRFPRNTKGGRRPRVDPLMLCGISQLRRTDRHQRVIIDWKVSPRYSSNAAAIASEEM